jgi:hypothetical protein
MTNSQATRETVAVGRLTITSPRERSADHACFVKSHGDALCFVRSR